MGISYFIAALIGTTICTSAEQAPPPPSPEPIEVVELPLPPVAPSDSLGACTPKINPHLTGCIDRTSEQRSGNFLPDNNHIVATVNFTGAPAHPDPASIFNGPQLIIIRTNDTTFPNGDPWKCITCGVPASNKKGSTAQANYPQAFKDGKRVLVGNNIVDGGADLVSSACTPNSTHIYPIRWNTAADGSGSGGDIRELRIHPDNVHLGFNAFEYGGPSVDQFGYLSRLSFNPSPASGEPRTPRYDLVNVTRLYNPNLPPPIEADGENLILNFSAINVGEFRGFTGRGDEAVYVGSSWESDNIDLFAVGLATGAVRRITEHPGYTDPIDVSQDNQWNVVLDTRGTNRTMFMDAMRHIPPLTDLVTVTAASSIRNNGQRRFFQPWLLDRAGDRGTYFGQQINAAGDGSPGSVNDPLWNARADPRWSWDQTKIAYFQALTVPPACGGANPLPCPTSTAPGRRTWRLMLAHLTSREPVELKPVDPVSDVVPWGTSYVPGSTAPTRYFPPGGQYTLKGSHSGRASVVIRENSSKTGVQSVAVRYFNYSDDGVNYIDGSENATLTSISQTDSVTHIFANLTSSGESPGRKYTSPDGFHLRMDVMTNMFEANGTLTTTVNGSTYEQPQNFT